MTDSPHRIPGTTNIQRIEENLGAFKVKISKEEEAEIHRLSQAAEPAGERYGEGLAQYCFMDTPEL